ncbi:MAG: hypothetical protein HPY69_04165 [Armatimonadetes bacterium]|nr:hypothetical protein [Armatimonadota bacterium]
MPTYEYGRIKVLADNLAAAGVSVEIAARILEGGEDVRKDARPERKARWMAQAMRRMDELLDADTRHAVREGCACCLGGERLKLSKAIARDHDNLADRLRAANATPSVFGHSVTETGDGRILVSFFPEGLEHYRCVCLPKAEGPVSITYCYCCGGHVKHHLQTALGRKLEMTVRSSALASAGKEPCTFLLKVVE